MAQYAMAGNGAQVPRLVYCGLRAATFGNMRHMRDIPLTQRLRAARELGGFRSADQLAAAIGEVGLSGRTLRSMESGVRKPRPMELRRIAEACGVPYAFFVAEGLRDALIALAEDAGPMPALPAHEAPPLPQRERRHLS